MNRAKKENWKTEEFPDVSIVVTINKKLSKYQFEKLQIGLIPQEMEDKWFIYMENNWLYFHRSWTGFCIFKIEIISTNDDYFLEEVFINRLKNQYNSDDINYDRQLVETLIDSLTV